MRTNKHNLPERVLAVIDGLNPPRPRPKKDIIHVTDLLLPAYAWNLYREKWDDVVEDYSDWLISCQGDALHEAYKKYLEPKGYLCEKALGKTISGVKLVGHLDVYNEELKTLVDLKQTSVWGPSYKVMDYTKQTNCYAYLMESRNFPVEKIYIDIWYRNWQLKQSTWSKDYPKIPYERMEIEVWPLDKTEQFIKDQIEYLTMCKDLCSREDKWQKYAVMKNANKTSSRNCDTEQEALSWIKKAQQLDIKKKRDKYRVVDTPPLSCLHYCKARSVCPYALSLV